MGQRTQALPTGHSRRRPVKMDKPEEQSGLLWNKFRPESVE